jgi:hypothetical protein
VSRYVVEPNSDATVVPKRVALIRREAPARLLEDRQELATTAPHLLLREVILVELVTVGLAVGSLLFDAPLEEIADALNTPNPAKAPWYFVGLQELLHYFPPVVAGVLLPALVVIAMVVIPFFRANVEVAGFYARPWRRNLATLSLVVGAVVALMAVYRVWPVLVPTVLLYALLALPALPVCPAGWKQRVGRIPLADWIMTWFVTITVVLILIGVLFRGPGWSWVWPWRDGVY